MIPRTNVLKFVVAVLGIALFAAIPMLGSAQEITVAAAADLTDPMKDLADGFEKQTRVHVRVVIGSSGSLSTQIKNGAPFDVFLSADMQYPTDVARSGLADGSSPFPYATGALAILVPANSTLKFEREGLRALLNMQVRKLAIANPLHAPYGRAAESLLRGAGLYDKLRPKMVTGENVAQTAQFVQSGNADAAIISRSLARIAVRDGRFRFWEPAQNSYPAIQQGAIVLSKSRNRESARAFLTYLRSPQGRTILSNYGFGLPSTQANNGEFKPQKRTR